MKGRERILDELLVLRSQDGDVAAFESLARRWQPRLLRLARRLTQSPEAGEVVQEASQDVAQLRKALPQLSDGHRGVLEMFYLRAFSVQTISEKLGVSPGTVKSRLFHARKVLRAALEESP